MVPDCVSARALCVPFTVVQIPRTVYFSGPPAYHFGHRATRLKRPPLFDANYCVFGPCAIQHLFPPISTCSWKISYPRLPLLLCSSSSLISDPSNGNMCRLFKSFWSGDAVRGHVTFVLFFSSWRSFCYRSRSALRYPQRIARHISNHP